MIILGYAGLLLMGVTLGLIGAGGAILTIPILVYLFNVPVILATTYSLAIVGLTAFVGGVRYRETISFRKALYFAVPSVLGVFLTRSYILDYLPQSIGGLSLDKALMLLLILFMLLSSYFMIQDRHLGTSPEKQSSLFTALKVILLGFCLGIIMGLLGAGGGFLIVPTLVLLLNLSIRESVPTSLFIITMNSLVGFIADKQHFLSEDGKNILLFSSIALLGMLVGIYLSSKISTLYLKKLFGWFVFVAAILIAIKEFFI